uniref:Uncharacterized protein n=1 Tax=viral metagenome TaxID=1070528 RepID=A0A6M3L100_9ZZZZ
MADKEFKYFKKWYKSQENRFHCGHFGDEDKAFASFCEGIEFERKRNLTPAAPDSEGRAIYCGVCGYIHIPGTKCPST